jgi:capsular polysaccharide biosynthesis protein
MASPAELLGRLLRQGGVLAGAVLLGVLGGAMYGVWKAPAYTADAHVVVVNTANAQDDQTAVKFAQAYGRISTDSAVLAATGTAKGGGSVAALRRQVRVETSPDAPIIQITGVAPNAARAAQIANEVAGSLVSFGNARSSQTSVRLASFAQASAPDGPSSPNAPLDIAVGAAAGLLIGGFATTAGVGTRRRRPEQVPVPVPVPDKPLPDRPVNGNHQLTGYRLQEPSGSDPGGSR